MHRRILTGWVASVAVVAAVYVAAWFFRRPPPPPPVPARSFTNEQYNERKAVYDRQQAEREACEQEALDRSRAAP